MNHYGWKIFITKESTKKQTKTKKNTHTHKIKSTINRNNAHNIYNILCTYQENPIEEVQLIYWIYVDKNRI